MRVLHFIYDDPENPWVGGGGAERVREIYRLLAGSIDVTVIAGAYPGSLSRVRDGVPYEFIGRPGPYTLSRLSYGREATRRMKAGRYDVAVFDFSVYTPIRVPTDRAIAHVVHMPIGPAAIGRFGGPVGRLIERRERGMLRRAREVSTTSEWMAAHLRGILPSEAHVEIVRTGVAERFFSVERAEADWLLYYGRFDWYQKGLDVLLDAASALLQRHPELTLVVAGRGKDAGRLRAEVDSSAVRERVRIVENPSAETVLELLAGARLMLHPSRFEGYPAVPAEAMAAGVPMVATDVGATREVAGRNPAIELVPAGDAGAVVNAATQLLESARRRRELSERGRQNAQDLRWERVAAEHRAFLERVAARRR